MTLEIKVTERSRLYVLILRKKFQTQSRSRRNEDNIHNASDLMYVHVSWCRLRTDSAKPQCGKSGSEPYKKFKRVQVYPSLSRRTSLISITSAMSYRVPNVPVADDGLSESGSSGSDSLDQDDGCSDWASDFGEALHTKSLFDDTVLPTPEECISHDKKNHGLDIKLVKETLGLDVYGLMRLVNIIRKEVSRRLTL